MKKFNVYTDNGDWLGIWAYNAEGAKRQVMRLTYGRAVITMVEAA